MKIRLTVLFSVLLLSTYSFSQKISCTIKNPDPKKSLVPNHIDSASRGLADNYYLWENGATIRVKFLSGSKKMQDKVKQFASQWQQYANVKFSWVKTGPAEIRILLGQGKGHNSNVGIMSKIDMESESMNLDTTDFQTDLSMQGTVLHEFGHALGLLHEHSSPISSIQWNKPKIYQEYWRLYEWDTAMVDFQVFEVYKNSYTNGTQYDPKSIMHYSIEPWETLNGYSVGWNHYLSPGDKQLIAALYPKTGVRKNQVPRVNVTKFSTIKIEENAAKGGLSIYPSFEMMTTGKTGKVYVISQFFDFWGNPVEDSDGKFSFEDNVAAMRSLTAIVNKKGSYNMNKKKDFEIFIPFNQVEVSSDDAYVYVLFRVVLATDDGEIKDVYYGDPVTYAFSGKHKLGKRIK